MILRLFFENLLGIIAPNFYSVSPAKKNFYSVCNAFGEDQLIWTILILHWSP